MQARRYKKSDYAMISSWMADRKMEMPPAKRLPKNGVIIDDCACAFLVKTDAKIGLLDFFMSNPNATEENRLFAYDLGLELLDKMAIKLGFEVLVASTSITKVMAVIMRHQMIGDGIPYYFFKKLLKGEDHAGIGSCKPAKPSYTESGNGNKPTE